MHTSWSTSFKTRRTQKTSSALEALWKTLFVLYLYLIGTLFVKQRGVKVPDTQKTWFNVSINLEECEKVCLRNCNCTAYANSNVRSGKSGCLIWLDDLVDIRMYGEDGQDIYVTPYSFLLYATDRKAKAKRRVIIVVIPVVVGMTLILGLCLFYRRRKHKKNVLGLKRLHGFLEVTAAQVHNGNYAKCAAGGKITILEAPMEDQPLPADASPTALSPGYIIDFDPEEDEEDPEEDPADHPVDGGYNDDNESSDDDDDNYDVVKDEEGEEEEHLASVDPSDVLIYDLVPSS
ncbi:G-type lectin S-receptor-like serine/threonine-protein kinase [Tanacetum coccineum]